MAASLFDAARACLDAASPEAKVAATFAAAEAFARGELAIPDDAPEPAPIDMPGRPQRPLLVHPRDLPRRGFGNADGRAAFIHAIAHIEFNAIDLAWDAAYRFRGLPREFYADWVGVARALRATDYRGWVVAETFAGRVPEIAAATAAPPRRLARLKRSHSRTHTATISEPRRRTVLMVCSILRIVPP